jgi:sulfate adenylyltransferase
MSQLPHGGVLINRYTDPSLVDSLTDRCGRLKSWQLSERELCDLELIASGALSPLNGFMGRSDIKAVLDNHRLSKGLPWTVPIHLTVPVSFASGIKPGEEIALLDETRKPIAILSVSDVFEYNALEYAHKAFKTTDSKHPGVAALYAMEPRMVGGDVTVLRRRNHQTFNRYRLEPTETRDLIQDKKWRTIAGYQSGEPVHRKEEYQIKCALETVDGLLLHPVVGGAAPGEIAPDVRMNCIEALIDNYFPKNRVLLAVVPGRPRFMGAREAVFQAIVQKNYGCTHYVVGSDALSADRSEARELFGQFESRELGITPVFIDDAFFCKACGSMATARTCPHTDVARLSFTGPEIRELLQKAKPLPLECTRAEIGVILLEAFRANKM